LESNDRFRASARGHRLTVPKQPDAARLPRGPRAEGLSIRFSPPESAAGSISSGAMSPGGQATAVPGWTRDRASGGKRLAGAGLQTEAPPDAGAAPDAR